MAVSKAESVADERHQAEEGSRNFSKKNICESGPRRPEALEQNFLQSIIVLILGIGQAVRHWVLVPGSGVRIPHPQPYKESGLFDPAFCMLECFKRPTSKDRGENCQWQFARKRSDASCAGNSELSGLPKVGRIPHPQPK